MTILNFHTLRSFWTWVFECTLDRTLWMESSCSFIPYQQVGYCFCTFSFCYSKKQLFCHRWGLLTLQQGVQPGGRGRGTCLCVDQTECNNSNADGWICIDSCGHRHAWYMWNDQDKMSGMSDIVFEILAKTCSIFVCFILILALTNSS